MLALVDNKTVIQIPTYSYKNNKVFIPHADQYYPLNPQSDSDYDNMFTSMGFELVDNIEDAHLVCFTGGSDIDPHLYQQTNVASYTNYTRDDQEISYFKTCIKLHKPMVGVCRGGQLLNVLSGGSMWQDVPNHSGDVQHSVRLSTGEEMQVNSEHHQQMILGPAGILIAYVDEVLNRLSDTGYHFKREKSVEVAWYPHTRSLCFQPHPEWDSSPEGMTDWFFELIEAYCFNPT